jgi:hypothetical protein
VRGDDPSPQKESDMKPAHSILSLLLLSVPLAAQAPAAPTLSIEAVGPAMQFSVAGPKAPFLGGVLLSLSPTLTHYFVGLPPLLSDFVVLGVGIADLQFSVQVMQHQLPAGILIYAQGVVADGVDVLATEVASFVLDASFPGGG